MKTKRVVAYFSCSGNTRKKAAALAQAAGADLVEIQPAALYTEEDLDWENPDSRSSVEMKDTSSRPAITGTSIKIKDADIIFLGFPIWWYVAPTIINTFLESYDFSGKTIIPFCTSGGSQLGNTEKVLRSLCPNTVSWRPGKVLNGAVSQKDLISWINGLEL